MKLYNIVMRIISGAMFSWTLYRWRTRDPAWRLSLGTALITLACSFIAPRIESVLFSLVCFSIAMYLFHTFRWFLPKQQ